MIRFIFASLILLLSLPFSAMAADIAKKGDAPIVTTRLLADVTAVTPGQDFTILVEQIIRPHWHTYWKNPGDSGTHLNLTWTLPDGFAAGPIAWPTPTRIETPPLVTYGYSDTARFPVTITVPDTIKGDTVTLTAAADWLVCEEICIPETADLTLTLPVGPSVPANADAFAAAQAALPRDVTWPATIAEADGRLTLSLQAPGADIADGILAAAAAFPAEWGLIQNAARPTLAATPEGAVAITWPRDTRALSDVPRSEWVVMGADNNAYRVMATLDTLAAAPASLKTGTGISLPGALIFAFLGGVILNLMPCVFPVLSLKALSLVQVAHGHRREAVIHGLSYTAGVILCFVAIAGLLIGLQQAGAAIGWGFQLQNPVVILLLTLLMFLLGLNLAGFFEVGSRLQNLGATLTNGHSYRGSFATGLLATIVATPCTAPFMAGALGFAATQPPPVALGVFATLGLGLAMPFLLLSLLPGLQRVLPKPGAWMEIFKQALAWPMFLTAAWLVWVLVQQIGAAGVLYALGGATLLGFAIWLRRLGGRAARMGGLLFLLTVLGLCMALPRPAAMVVEKREWIHYTPEALEKALQTDRPVLVNMTAAWCITCKVNERTSLDTHTAHALYAANNVILMRGDWTNRDSAITEFLQRAGRNGVPLYVLYAAPDAVTGERPEPIVLPQLLTPQIVADALQTTKEGE